VGVVNRVEALADRPEGFKPQNAIPFKNLIPLDEIIASAKGVGKASVSVERDYQLYLNQFGTEFDILLRASREELIKTLPPKIAEGVLLARQGKVNIRPGYDGEYGTVSVFEESSPAKNEEQLNLF
jgi:PHP family Zn ribbon phosphoesterase